MNIEYFVKMSQTNPTTKTESQSLTTQVVSDCSPDMTVVRPKSIDAIRTSLVVPSATSVEIDRATSASVRSSLLTRLGNQNYMTTDIATLGYDVLFQLINTLGMSRPLFGMIPRSDLDQFKITIQSQEFLRYVSYQSLRTHLTTLQNGTTSTKVGNCRTRLLHLQGVYSWYDHFMTQFDMFFTQNVAAPVPVPGPVADAVPVPGPVADAVPVPLPVSPVLSQRMMDLVNQQVQRVSGLDVVVPVRPDIPTNADRVQMLQQVMSMRNEFRNTYAQAVSNFNEALDEYIQYQAKTMVLQRLIELRRVSNTEEFEFE